MPKSLGMGILNLKQMNCALLCKWGWKYWYKDAKDYWKELIALHYGSFSLLHSSPFLEDIAYVLYFVVLSSSRLIGNDAIISGMTYGTILAA
jgi:hypothetical protein